MLCLALPLQRHWRLYVWRLRQGTFTKRHYRSEGGHRETARRYLDRAVYASQDHDVMAEAWFWMSQVRGRSCRKTQGAGRIVWRMICSMPVRAGLWPF